MKTYISTIALLAALSACTTATIPVAPGDPATIPQEDVNAFQAELVDTLGSILTEDTIYTPDMPTTGTAQYAGNILLSDAVDGSYAALGDLTLDANFESASITGTATNFNAIEVVSDTPPPDVETLTLEEALAFIEGLDITLGTAVTGELVIDGEIESNGFQGSLAGELTGLGLDDEEITVVIDALIGGGFFTSDGSGADIVFGAAEGTGDTGDSTFPIAGFFLAD